MIGWLSTIEHPYGWFSALFLGVCGVPAARKAYKEGHARGISAGFLWLWTIGEFLMLLHVTIEVVSLAMVANVLFNLCVMSVIIRYKLVEAHRHFRKYRRYEGLNEVTLIATDVCECGYKFKEDK